MIILQQKVQTFFTLEPNGHQARAFPCPGEILLCGSLLSSNLFLDGKHAARFHMDEHYKTEGGLLCLGSLGERDLHIYVQSAMAIGPIASALSASVS